MTSTVFDSNSLTLSGLLLAGDKLIGIPNSVGNKLAIYTLSSGTKTLSTNPINAITSTNHSYSSSNNTIYFTINGSPVRIGSLNLTTEIVNSSLLTLPAGNNTKSVVAVYNDKLYIVAVNGSTNDRLYSCNLDGSNPSLLTTGSLVSGTDYMLSAYCDGTYMYYTDNDFGITRLKITAPFDVSKYIISTPPGAFACFAVDPSSTYLYVPKNSTVGAFKQYNFPSLSYEKDVLDSITTGGYYFYMATDGTYIYSAVNGGTSITRTLIPNLGTPPTINSVNSVLNGLNVYYTPGTGPGVTTYGYSANSSVQTSLSSTSNPLFLPFFTAAYWNIQIYATNTAGNTNLSNTLGNIPYISGSNPNITSVVSQANALSVTFKLSTGGYPVPNYYYSTTGNVATGYTSQFDATGTTSNTFVIPYFSANANISILAVNSAGNVYSGNTWIATPYLLGTAPNIISVTPQANSLSVSFMATLGGNPLIDAGNYYYSIDGGLTVSQANPTLSTSNTFVINNLTTYTSYTVQLYSSNPAGNLYSMSSVDQVIPYVIANVAPTILSVYSNLNSLLVSFTNVQNSYPLPYYYYTVYNVDTGNTIYSSGNSGVTSNVSGNLNISVTVGGNYKVQLTAVNPAGNISSANVAGVPFIRGTLPNITNVVPVVNGLAVSFNLSANGFPRSDYYYSNSGNTALGYISFTPTGTTSNTFIVPFQSANANISILVNNYDGGNVYSANTWTATPYLLGTAPNITSIQSQASNLVVSFTGSVGANPQPYYYYSVNNSEFANTGMNNASTPIIIQPSTLADSYTVQLAAVNAGSNVFSANVVYTVSNATGLQNAYMNQFLLYQRPLTTQEVSIIYNNPNTVVFSNYASVVGIYPVITQVSSNVNSLDVQYVGSPDANPAPYYYYNVSLPGNAPITGNSGINTNTGTIHIDNLTTTGNYTVQLTAVSSAGDTTSANSFGTPYTVGTQPNILSVANLANSISVSFQGVSNWYPAPSYYYSITGNAIENFVPATVSDNSFTISGLTLKNDYSVYLFANNFVGYQYSATIGNGSPYVLGTTAPVILNVYSNLNGMLVSFSPVQNANPKPYYYYTVYNPANTVVYYGNSGLNGNTANISINNVALGNYNVQLTAVNPAGNVSSGNVSGFPYILGTAPVIDSVANIANGLAVSFQVSSGGYPAPVYYYTINGGSTYSLASIVNGNTFTIPDLTTATSYGVKLLAYNPGGNLLSVNTVYGKPYVLGTTPVITKLLSNVNSLDIYFEASRGANPDPEYFYSVNGNATYVSAGVYSNSNIINVPGLTNANLYTISLRASNPAGILTSDSSSAMPFVIGGASLINTVNSGANSLVVYFNAPTNWNPLPFYYYTIDGTNFSNSHQQSDSQPITIPGLYTYSVYTVRLIAYNTAGNVKSVNSYSAIPGVLGTAPAITRIKSAYNSLILSFAASDGGNPAPSYYYSVDGGTYVDTGYNSNSADITIPSLTVANSYSIQLQAVNLAGSLYSDASSGIPYVIGTTPNITAVEPRLNSLSVKFNKSTGGYPVPYYYYSTDGINYENSNVNSNVAPIVVPDLNTPSLYTVYLKAGSVAGNTSVSTIQGTPYIIGTAPTITSVDPSLNKLTVYFDDSVDGNPSPSAHYYSTDGGNTYTYTSTSSSPIVISSGLTVAKTYSIVLIAVNAGGNTAPSNAFNGTPYVIGTQPNITAVAPGLNQLSVYFTGPVGGYPEPTTYYYSTDDGQNYSTYSSNISPLVIANLTVAKSYGVKLVANNLGGNTVASDVYNATPYVIGTPPNIGNVISGINTLTVNFSYSENGYPSPSTYLYSTDGGNTYIDSLSSVSPIVIGNLTTAKIYPVSLIAVNTGGNTEQSNTVNGQPYVIGDALVVSTPTSIIEGLEIRFTGPVGGYPDPTNYYYSLDGSGYVLANVAAGTSTFTINKLTEAKNYTIRVIAQNLAGNTAPSVLRQGIPYVTGTSPVISDVVSGINMIYIYYSGSISIYPPPTTYYYSLDGGDTYTDAQSVANPITVGNLYVANNYPIKILAQNAAGNTVPSALYYGKPYVAGIRPNVVSVSSGVNSLTVQFLASIGAYDTPYYYYSTDGIIYTNSNANSNVAPIVIPNLTVAKTYSVSIMAVNSWGNLKGSSLGGNPYVVGTQPNILSIAPGTNTLSVTFQGSANAYPTPYYYYSTDGGTTYSNAHVQTDDSPITIGNLNIAKTYDVRIMAVNAGGNTKSGSVPAKPYVIGTRPNIISLIPGTDSLSISFMESTNAYPLPYYYYSVDGGEYSNSEVQSNASTILISDLTSAKNYTIGLKGVSVAGNTEVSTLTGEPYVIGSVPVITNVSSNVNSLTVDFRPSTGGYPAPNAYYYSLDEGDTYVNANTTTSPLTITGLTVAQTYYFQIIAQNLAGNTELSLIESGEPYVIGSAPVISSVSSIPYGLQVDFEETTDGNPDPTAYYYSTDGGNTYIEADQTETPIYITDLSQNRSYPVTIFAHNLIGNTVASTRYSGTPYVMGSTPVVSNVISIYNGLQVVFSESTGGNPAPSSYFYTFDGGDSFYDSESTTSPIYIYDLTTAGVYSVAVYANNLAGDTAISNYLPGEPYVIGSPPILSSVTSIYNGLSVSFTGSTDGYPEPSSYFYSIDGDNFLDSGSNVSPILIHGLNTARVYSVVLQANSVAGRSNSSNELTGEPYVIGSAPTNVKVSSILNGLSISFTPSTDGYPVQPSSYFYSLNGGNTFVNSLVNTSPIVVANLNTPTLYSVVLYGNSIAGRSANTIAVSGKPWIIGSAPVISNVLSGYNSIIINFTGFADGNPEPATYYYTLNGGNTFINTSSIAQQITLNKLTTANTYSVGVMAGSVAGNTLVSNLVPGRPYVIGSAPNISNITSVLNGISISFSGSTSGYPDPTTYYYSLNGGLSFQPSDRNTSPILINNLTSLTPYSVALQGVNAVWPDTTASSNFVQGRPYIIGSRPVITDASSIMNGLSVSFTAFTNGFPNPTSYFYSTDGGATFADSLSNVSPIIIANLNVAQTYSVVIYANSIAGNTALSVAVPGKPYILGSVPIISNVLSIPYGITINFTGSTNGFPSPTTYYYSLDGGNTYTNASSNSSPITVSFPRLTTPNIYSVALYAFGLSGNTATSSAVSGRPYIAGSAPIITTVSSIYNGLSVDYVGSVGGYPDATSYYYSVDGGATYKDWGNTTNPIVIGNLTRVSTPYNVKLLAVNAAGNSSASNTVQGTPFVIGTAPSILLVNSILNGISIVFTPPQNGYPAPTTYYYSLDGGNSFTDSLVNTGPIVVSNLTTPTTYSVALYAVNAAGSTAISARVSGAPFVIGSAPYISNVASGYNSITINFTETFGGTPGNTFYFYSLDGGNTFANSRVTSSPITVGSLTQPLTYSVVLYSVSAAGQSGNSNMVSGRPFVIGTRPTIQSINSIPGGLAVNYTPPTNGFPEPTTYFYSLNSGTYVNANSNANPLLITGLLYKGSYRVQIYAVNSAGNTPSSLAVSGRPYILGSTPYITDVVPELNKLTINFNLSTGGEPDPTSYFYSFDGVNYVNSGLTTSPIVVGGLTQATVKHVSVKANSLAGMTSASNTVDRTPYVIGTKPTVTRIVPGINQLSFYFTNSTDGYPLPSSYLYSFDGSEYVDSGVNSNVQPIVVSNLANAISHSFSLVAQSDAGLSQVFGPVYGTPYVLGTAPNIRTVSPIVGTPGALSVVFNPSTGGYPDVETYYYSIDGGFTFQDARSSSSPIVITGLSLQSIPYLVMLKAYTYGWESNASVPVSGVPYIVGTPPVISNVVSINNGLSVSFTDSTGGRPAPTKYYYTLNGGNTYALAGNTSSPIIIGGLTVENVYYVGLVANNLGGNTAISNQVPGVPNVIGQPPVISNVVSGSNSLLVNFEPPVGDNPDPFAYYYTVNGGNTYILANETASPITIPNLYEPRVYSVQLIARNVVGNTAPSLSASGQPYTLGGNVGILDASSIYNGLVVRFTPPVGWYPVVDTYYYSVDGGNYVLMDSSSSPLTIGNLTVATSYSVAIKATNSLGLIAYSNAVIGNPFVIGTAPTIQHVYNVLNGISVSFIGSQGGYPAPSTYLYSVDGGNTYSNSRTNRSPVVITGFTGQTPYVVSLKAVNAAGISGVSNSFSGNTYEVGHAPVITEVQSILNGLVVAFTPSPVSYATPIVYMYSLDGVNYVDTGCVGSPLTIGNLTVAGAYTISIKGVLQMSNVSTTFTFP